MVECHATTSPHSSLFKIIGMAMIDFAPTYFEKRGGLGGAMTSACGTIPASALYNTCVGRAVSGRYMCSRSRIYAYVSSVIKFLENTFPNSGGGPLTILLLLSSRSEERRVGSECSS